jgi:hypothetical protein
MFSLSLEKRHGIWRASTCSSALTERHGTGRERRENRTLPEGALGRNLLHGPLKRWLGTGTLAGLTILLKRLHCFVRNDRGGILDPKVFSSGVLCGFFLFFFLRQGWDKKA